MIKKCIHWNCFVIKGKSKLIIGRDWLKIVDLVKVNVYNRSILINSSIKYVVGNDDNKYSKIMN